MTLAPKAPIGPVAVAAQDRDEVIAIARAERSRRMVAALAAAAVAAVAVVPGAPTIAAAEVTTSLRASYAITLAIFTIGKVDVAAHFTAEGYSANITGSTTGLGRLVSDSRAELKGDGAFAGSRVPTASYSLRTAEGDFFTRVDLSLHDGSPAKIDVDPTLLDAPDRVPLTADALRHVFDPVSALLIVRETAGAADGKTICNRTVPIFDGWVRYDIALSYKETTNFAGGRTGYTGPVVICQARYVPVAGHRLSRDSVEYMAQNKRLEAWMVPVKGTNLMVPIKFVIGTTVGDLAVTARDFVVTTVNAASVTDRSPATR
jgi:uncharacterized protein DUF3108